MQEGKEERRRQKLLGARGLRLLDGMLTWMFQLPQMLAGAEMEKMSGSQELK